MLEDIAVVEVGNRLSTAYFGRLLIDAGATVVKLEDPRTGDPLRTSDPAFAAYLHGGKRSVADAEALLPIAGRVDMLICDDEDDHGLELAATLRERNPNLVLVSLSDYGLFGPCAGAPATEFTLQAEAGIMALHDTNGWPPVVTGVPLGEMTAGIAAAVGAMVGLLAADAGEPGVDVDVSRFEALIEMLLYPWLFDQIAAHNPYPVPATPVPGIERAKDGWACVVCVTPQQWVDFKRMAGVPELEDPRFDTLDLRTVCSAEVTPLVRRFTARHTIAELVELGALHRVPITPVGTPESIPSLPPYASRRTFLRNEDVDFVQPRPPFRFGGDEDGWAPRPIAVIGEHTDDPLGALSQAVRPTPATRPTDPVRPLTGLRVVELGLFQAGPLATMNLAALGADVVKIEAVSRPDMIRFAGMAMDQDRSWERGAVFNSSNLGKRAITADLNDPRGLEVVRRLIAESDVVLENFSPRVLEAIGLDEAGVRALRPDAVVVRMPAWGLTGPWRDRPGFTYSADASSGIAELTGFPDGEPMLTGTIVDPIAALVTTFITLAALRRRQRTGEGAYVTVPLCDIAPQLTAQAVIEASHTGRSRTRAGNRSLHATPQGTYRCSDGEWVAVSVATDEQWAALASLPETKQWAADQRFSDVSGRQAHGDALDTELAAVCSRLAVAEVVGLLRAAGVPAAPVTTGTELLEHPQLRARQRVFRVDHPVIGSLQYIGKPFRLSHAPAASAPRPAPLFGQDNQAVLSELGYTDDEITALAIDGLLGDSPFGIPFARDACGA